MLSSAPLAVLTRLFLTTDSIRDRHGLKLADYLHPESSETDKAIVQLIRAALAESMASASNNADLADSDDGAGGSGSESD